MTTEFSGRPKSWIKPWTKPQNEPRTIQENESRPGARAARMPPSQPWRHTLPDRNHPDAVHFRSAFEILRSLDLFAPVSDGELLKFSTLGFERRVERDHAVIPGAGRYVPPLALLLEGEAVLSWGHGPDELFLQGLEPGDLIGEAEVFDGSTSSECAPEMQGGMAKPLKSLGSDFGSGLGVRSSAVSRPSRGGFMGAIGSRDTMMVREDAGAREVHGRTFETGRVESRDRSEEWFGEPKARAVTTVRILEWDRDAICEALRRWPDVALSLLSGLARRQRTLERRVASLCCLRAPGRLARVLTALLEERGRALRDEAGRRGVLLLRTPSRTRLSEISGMARETVSRLLTDWERRGWITDHAGDLLVLDGRQLRRLAGTNS